MYVYISAHVGICVHVCVLITWNWQIMEGLVPGGHCFLLSRQPLTPSKSSSRSGAFRNFPVHTGWPVNVAILLGFHECIFLILYRRCYLVAGVSLALALKFLLSQNLFF